MPAPPPRAESHCAADVDNVTRFPVCAVKVNPAFCPGCDTVTVFAVPGVMVPLWSVTSDNFVVCEPTLS